MSRNCLWDLYRRRVGRLLANVFPLSLATVQEVIAKVSFLFLKGRIKDLDSGFGESTTFQTFFMALIPLSPAYSKTNL